MDAEKLREIGHKIAKMEGGEKDGAFIVQMALRLAMLEEEARRLRERASDLEASLELSERSGGYGV